MVGLLDHLTRALLRHFKDLAVLNAQQAADMVVILSEGLIHLNKNAVSTINSQLLCRDRVLAMFPNNLTEVERLRARTMPFDSVDLFGSRAKYLKA